MSVKKAQRQALKALSGRMGDPDMKKLTCRMVFEHVASEVFWEACGWAHQAHLEEGEHDDMGPLSQLALQYQGRMYDCNLAKKRLAIAVKDNFGDARPDSPAVRFAQEILHGEADRDRWADFDRDRSSPEDAERLARQVAASGSCQ